MHKYSIAGTLAGLAAMLVLAGVAVAGKPSSSLNLVVVGSSGLAPAAAPAPSYGGQITFDVSTNQTDRPFVNVRCYQGTSWVFDGWQGFFSSYVPEPLFLLASDYWTGGAADCTARLVYFDQQGRLRTLASTDFHVNA